MASACEVFRVDSSSRQLRLHFHQNAASAETKTTVKTSQLTVCIFFRGLRGPEGGDGTLDTASGVAGRTTSATALKLMPSPVSAFVPRAHSRMAALCSAESPMNS